MNKDEFFSSKKSDKGVLIRKNKENELTFSFIGNKGPFSVVLDEETSSDLADHILDIWRAEGISPAESASFIKEHVAKFKKFSELSQGSSNHELSSRITEADRDSHPLLRGNKDDPPPLSGEVKGK